MYLTLPERVVFTVESMRRQCWMICRSFRVLYCRSPRASKRPVLVFWSAQFGFWTAQRS